METNFLKQILQSNSEYWVVAKKDSRRNGGVDESLPDDIIFISIPQHLINKKYEDIKLSDLEELDSLRDISGIHLSKSYTPFQYGISMYRCYKGFPVEKKIREFIEKVISLRNNNLYYYEDIYKELIGDIGDKQV